MLTVYGLGTIIGAGIYVLVGEIAGHAGVFAPVAFLVAAIVAAVTGFTYGELAARLPFSAGEAVYVNTAFQRKWLSAVTGWAVVLTGVVSAAALVTGFSGYFLVFVQLPEWWVVIILTVALGGIAAWGIEQSAWFAAVITVLSVLGLVWVLVVAFSAIEIATVDLDDLLPPLNTAAWSGIFVGGFLAFYAYIGFEDMVNVAEEVHHPERTIPRAIFIALVISTLLYALVAFAAVFTLPIDELRSSRAPLVDMMAAQGKSAEKGIALLSLMSVVNGALVQVIMASRVLYGMARHDMAPVRFGHVNPVTRTPVLATGVTVLVVLTLALWLPIGTLAQIASLVVLLVFAVMHLALLRLKITSPRPDGVNVISPAWPALGLLLTLGLILFRGLSFV
jgi:amino acid transporter